MEPQIIDYYNEHPDGINIIDKLNDIFNYTKYDTI